MTENNLPNLPNRWIYAMLGNLCEIVEKKDLKQDSLKSFNYIEITSIDNSRQKISNTANILGKDAPSRARQLVKKGDTLFSTVRTYLKNIAMVPSELDNQIASTGFCVIRPAELVDKKFIFYLVQTDSFLNRLTKLQRGTSYPAVRDSDVFGQVIPLAPYNEQLRIVGKVEELFSYLDAGVESLFRVQVQLKRYRQTVLKAAFEGKLTEEWRKANKGKVKLTLLSEEQNSSNLPPIDTTSLQRLPEQWSWVRLRKISDLIQYGTSEKADMNQKGVPVLRMGNIQDGALDFTKLKYLPKGTINLSDFSLEDGDVLFNRTNSAELVGKTAVYKNCYPQAVFASYLIRIKPKKNLYKSELLSHYINSFYGKKYISSVVSQQVGQANVNGTKLSMMPLPLIPFEEQQVLNNEVERLLSVLIEMEKMLISGLKQSEVLRQSILKDAFSGVLVPQNPNDVSVEKLLEHIKAERASNNKSNIISQLELPRYVK